MKFTIREMMMSVLLVAIFVRWVAVDVVYRERIVKAWRETQMDLDKATERVKRLERHVWP